MVFKERNANGELILQTACTKESCRFQYAFCLPKGKTKPTSRGLHYITKNLRT